MSFVNKIIGELSYMFKGQDCQTDLQNGMSDRDLVKKYGEYTLLKVKGSLVKK
jgi:hypothetical protein